jgi:hypothetical protein
MTISCGNLKCVPSIEHSTERFLNQVGALAIKENTPFTVLNESHFRRVESSSFDRVRKNKHYIYLNLQEELNESTPRIKIATRSHLITWLEQQGDEGKRVLKIWKLEN